jgi:hypothetical protein
MDVDLLITLEKLLNTGFLAIFYQQANVEKC